MIGRFIGQDKSMGFRTGQLYRFHTYCRGDWLVLDAGNGLWCPYGCLEKLLENWDRLEK